MKPGVKAALLAMVLGGMGLADAEAQAPGSVATAPGGTPGLAAARRMARAQQLARGQAVARQRHHRRRGQARYRGNAVYRAPNGMILAPNGTLQMPR